MALAAGFGDVELADSGFPVLDRTDFVFPMAIGAHRDIRVPLFGQVAMHTPVIFLEHIFMALSAGFGHHLAADL